MNPSRWLYSLTFLICLATAAALPCAGQAFKQYPGSKLDEQASKASSGSAGKESLVYTTTDSIEKVSAYYKALYKEVTMRSPAPKLPSGEQVQWSFFAIDGETSLSKSKFWMKVQRPFVFDLEGKDIRQLTVIQTVRTR